MTTHHLEAYLQCWVRVARVHIPSLGAHTWGGGLFSRPCICRTTVDIYNPKGTEPWPQCQTSKALPTWAEWTAGLRADLTMGGPLG